MNELEKASFFSHMKIMRNEELLDRILSHHNLAILHRNKGLKLHLAHNEWCMKEYRSEILRRCDG